MNITRENIDELNAVLTVKVEKDDYQEKVDKVLFDYRKTANLKGFRKGKVPMGFIKKQYGSSVLGDELNKLVNESLNNYLKDNQLVIFGTPLPKEDVEMKGDFNNPETFEFTYEIGLRPQVEVDFSEKNKYEYPKVKMDEKLLNQQIADLTRRYGKLVSVDEVEEKDMIFIQFY